MRIPHVGSLDASGLVVGVVWVVLDAFVVLER